MNIVLLGPPGAGKGTHAGPLCSRYNLRHIASGDLLRQNLAGDSAAGALARKYMDEGELVPDEVVDAMVGDFVCALEPGQGALFDGFPRTVYQAQFLADLMRRCGLVLDAAIYLDAADAPLVERLAGRLNCSTCNAPYHTTLRPPQVAGVCDRCSAPLYQRSDDAGDRIGIRMRAFHRTTAPVIDFYARISKLIGVSGEGPIDAVKARLIAIVDAVRAHSHDFTTCKTVPATATAAAAAGALSQQAARRSCDLVLLGGPGSGKGTQAEQLSRQLKLPHIATGDLFRENLKNDTALGKLARTYMNRGELVPDDVTEAMVEERLARPDTQDGFILDGFPRTLPQAHALTELLAGLKRQVAGVLYIKVSDEAIVNRLAGRLICRNCQTPYHQTFKPPEKSGVCDNCAGELYQRDDDNPNTVRARLKTFHGQTEPLIEYYAGTGVLHEIIGEGEVAQVVERTLAVARAIAPDRG
jgi:adenylate kinase